MTNFRKDNQSPEAIASSGSSKPRVRREMASSIVQAETRKDPDPHPFPSNQQGPYTIQSDAPRHDLKEDTVGAAFSPDVLKDQGDRAIDSAKDLASKADQKVEEQVATHKNIGAKYIGKIASAMQRAANEVEKDMPFAATSIKDAADQLEDMSDSLRDGRFSDFAPEALAFARRQPVCLFRPYSFSRIWPAQILEKLCSQ